MEEEGRAKRREEQEEQARGRRGQKDGRPAEDAVHQSEAGLRLQTG